MRTHIMNISVLQVSLKSLYQVHVYRDIALCKLGVNNRRTTDSQKINGRTAGRPKNELLSAQGLK